MKSSWIKFRDVNLLKEALTHPSSTPGDLSILRQVIVSNEALGCLTPRLNLDKYLCHNLGWLNDQIQMYKNYIETGEDTYMFECPKPMMYDFIKQCADLLSFRNPPFDSF